MSVVDDLLNQLAAETRRAGREVVSDRPSQASSNGGGAKGSTPEALEAHGSLGTASEDVKLRLRTPVVFTQVAPCEDCICAPQHYFGQPVGTACEIDGTCWKAEREEVERLKAAGEYDTAPAAWVAPWSKRAIRVEEERLAREAEQQEVKRAKKVEELKTGGWKNKRIPGAGSKTFGAPEPTPAETLAEATVEKPKKINRGSRPGITGQPPKLSVEQVEWAVQEQEFRSLRAVAFERWQEWGYRSPAAAYQGLRGQITRLGLPLLDGRRHAEGPRAREEKKADALDHLRLMREKAEAERRAAA